MEDYTLLKRVKLLQNDNAGNEPVLYWMIRDQKVFDNYALLFTQHLANERNSGIVVCFNLQNDNLNLTLRKFDFLIKGLQKIETTLNDLNISFFIILGYPEITLTKLILEIDAHSIITEFFSLKEINEQKHKVVLGLLMVFIIDPGSKEKFMVLFGI